MKITGTPQLSHDRFSISKKHHPLRGTQNLSDLHKIFIIIYGFGLSQQILQVFVPVWILRLKLRNAEVIMFTDRFNRMGRNVV